MDLAVLWKAIYDRAQSDTGTNKLLGGGGLLTGFYNTQIPEVVDMPYAVYSTASATEMDAFTKDIAKVIVRIAFFAPVAPEDSSAAMATCSAIIDRISGDSSGGSTPTYGFHRWKATLAGSWVATEMMRTQVIENHGDDYYSFVIEFDVYMSK